MTPETLWACLCDSCALAGCEGVQHRCEGAVEPFWTAQIACRINTTTDLILRWFHFFSVDCDLCYVLPYWFINRAYAAVRGYTVMDRRGPGNTVINRTLKQTMNYPGFRQ